MSTTTINQKYMDYLRSIGITQKEDIDNISSAEGIEIRILYEDSDEHEGYYSTIDSAIEALENIRKLFPQLNEKEK